MDTSMQHAEQIKSVIASALGLDDDDILDSLSQQNCAEWTSLRHMVLLVSLEDEFGVSFSTDEMISMTSLARINTVMQQHAGVAA